MTKVPDLTKDARLRLYELVGYPQEPCPSPLASDLELSLAGLLDPETGLETAEGHRVAEVLLFC